MRASREVRNRSPNRSPSAERASGFIRKVYHASRAGWPGLDRIRFQGYGQGIRCLFHLPSGDPGRGGEHGEKPLGILQTRSGTSPPSPPCNVLKKNITARAGHLSQPGPSNQLLGGPMIMFDPASWCGDPIDNMSYVT